MASVFSNDVLPRASGSDGREMSGDVTNLKFIITEPNGNCEKCLRWTRNKK